MIARIGFACLLLMSVVSTGWSAEPKPVGFLSVSADDENRSVEIAPGDIVELRFSHPFAGPDNPEGIAKLKVDAPADVTLLAVVRNLPGGRLLPGSGTISALVIPKKAGTVKVTVTATQEDGKVLKPVAFQIKASLPE